VEKVLVWEPLADLEKGLATTYRWIENMVERDK